MYNVTKERKIMEEKNNNNFQNNLKYLLTNLEKDISKADSLEDKIYFEMAKSEIQKALKYIYESIKNWEKQYNEKKYEAIASKFNEINSLTSLLEFCLADYESEFHMDGISYSVFQIGKDLSKIMRSEQNGRQ